MCLSKQVVDELRSMLHSAINAGAAVRQEVVSMLSCLLLAPRHGERVLDMCAAPGSKTTQLLGATQPRHYDTTAVCRASARLSV